MTLRSVLLASSLALALVGCGGGAISTSQPVTVSNTAEPGDVKSGVLTWDRGINNDSGTPFANFIGAARQALEGKDPSRLELTSASLFLGGQSQGVTGLEQVFDGRVDMLFQTSHTSYPAAHVDSVSGAGPVDFNVDLDWNAVGASDRTELLNGNFKIVLRGNAVPAFTNSNSKADLQTTLGFQAFE